MAYGATWAPPAKPESGTGVFLPCAPPAAAPARRGPPLAPSLHAAAAMLLAPSAYGGACAALPPSLHSSSTGSATSLFSMGLGSPPASLEGSPRDGTLSPPELGFPPAGAAALARARSAACDAGSSADSDMLVARFFRVPPAGWRAGAPAAVLFLAFPGCITALAVHARLLPPSRACGHSPRAQAACACNSTLCCQAMPPCLWPR